MKFKSDIEVQAGLKDSSGSAGASGQVLSSNGATVSWINSGGGFSNDVQNTVKAGVAINKGQAVYVTSADGTNIIVGLASNTSEATSSKTLGLLNATVSINGFAEVIQIGKLSGLNTSTATIGDPVWLGTNGNLIYGLVNKPHAPAHLVYIGVVTRVNANNGEIFITVQNGFELDELHNVSAQTPSNNNGIFYNTATSLWEAKSISAAGGVEGSGTTNYVSKFTGASTIGNSQIFDNGTNVGIGTSSPGYSLDVTGSIRATQYVYANDSFVGNNLISTSNTDLLINKTTAYNILLYTNGAEKMRITSAGNVGIGTTSPTAKLDLGTSGALKVTQSGITEVYVEGTGVRLKNIYTGSGWARSILTYEDSAGTDYFQLGGYGSGQTFTYAYIGPSYDAPWQVWRGSNVGIGTTAPRTKLHIASTSSAIVSPVAGSATNSATIISNSVASYGLNFVPSGNGDIHLQAQRFDGATTLYNINLNPLGGNVGIGTASPVNTSGYGGLTLAGSSGSILSMVQGSLETFRVTNATGYSFINTTGHTPLLFGTNATERMRISDPGNVGIGTSDPIDKLEVSSNVSTDSTSLVLTNINNGSNTTKASSILFRLADTAGTIKRSASITSYTEGVNIIDAGLSFKTRTSDADPTEKMRITSIGNVGIGITSPSEKLNVSGNILATGSIKGASIGMTNIVTGYVPYFNGSILDDSPIYTNGGNVGIGTASPSAPLAIGRVNSIEEGGQIDLCRSSDNASSWGIDVFGSTSTPSLRFVDNVASATRMSIDGNGYVGIGTTSPIATLDVAGSFRATTGDTFIEVTGSVVIAGNTGDSQMMLEPGVASFGISPGGDFKGVRADADNGVWFHNESGRQFGLSREKNELFAKGNIIQNAQGPGNTTTIVKWIKIYNQDDSSIYFMPLYQ